MYIVITENDLTKLKAATRADLMAHLLPTDVTTPPGSSDGFDWEDVVDLTPGKVEEFMQGCSEETIAGLKVIAEHGPMINATLLNEAGIHNYGHFQGRVTKRTRTVTRDKHAYLLAYDDWYSDENGGVGHYAVTKTTHRSLRIFFNLD